MDPGSSAAGRLVVVGGVEDWSSAGAVPDDGNASESMRAGQVSLVCEDRHLPVWYHLCVSS